MGNTKIRPIAMKCNQEQFDAVKNIFHKKNIHSSTMSDSCRYLINYFDNNDEFGIGFYWSNDKYETYETWNEEIFLNACGIGTEPTYTITKEQLLELENGFTLPKLKQWFPDVFEVKKKMTQEQIESELGYKIEIIQP